MNRKSDPAMIDKVRTDPIDKEIGGRVRLRRRIVGVSQTELSLALGVSYQQVQKYENGKNRIGASRLQKIAHVLDVPVSFFFGETAETSNARDSAADLAEFLASKEGLELNGAFFRIGDARLRRSILGMVKSVAAIEHHASTLDQS
jgi:transcriptional regulator with XRE-family HTH domain